MTSEKKGCFIPCVLFVAALVFSGLALKDYYPFLASDIQLWELREDVVHDDGEDTWADSGINWKKLLKKNPDIIAWIRVPGTKIDYPVMRCQEWNEYLHRSYSGEYSYPGSIFIQPEAADDFSDAHTIIYGHNMRNLSMFGSLHKFESKDFYKKHHDVYIYQPGQAIHAVPYSTYDCRDATETYYVDFPTEKEWGQWLDMTMAGSYYSMAAHPAITDQVVTLSTCSNGRTESSRYVVNCVIKDRRILE